MGETWNFHGYVALPLEECGKRVIGPRFMSADEIEAGGFIDAMKEIISALYLEDDVVSEFAAFCSGNEKITPSEMDKETATELFNEFMRLYKNAMEKRR